MAFKLSDDTKRRIAADLGVEYDEIGKMSASEQTALVESRIGKKLTYRDLKDPRLPARGSVYLSLFRFFEFNRKEIDRAIDLIK